MPKLPDASNLSGVNIGAPRSMVDMPVPDIAGAAGAVARGISDAGQAVTSFAVERQERFRKQERFDTKMGLLKAEEAYAERVKDLDPLDPEYVEKKKAFRREVFAPVLSAVKDPENRQFFDLSTYEDFVNVGLRAEGEHRQARLKKTEIDISTFADTKLKTVINGGYTGDPLAEVEQQIDDSELDETAKLALKQKYRSAFNATTVDTAFSEITTKGYTLRPDVQTAIAATAEAGAPDWMRNYLERLAAVESAGGYNLSTNLSTAGGIYAFTDSTGRQYGLTSAEDKNDAGKATDAAIRFTMDNFRSLQKVLGRDPTPGELYLAHQQGSDGVRKLIQNPDRTAASVVGLKAVENNLPKSMKGRAATMKAGDFLSYWGTKFESGTAVIPPDDAMSVLENMPQYQQLDAADQIKVRESVATQSEKLRKEAQKDFEITTAREYANTAAAGATTLVEGYNWIDENVKDPQIAEKARTMFKSEFEANEKAREVQYDDFLNGVRVDVINAVNRGDINAALEAIPASGLKAEDFDKLQERIAKGPIQFDDPKILGQLRYLKYGTDEDRAEFANMDLRRYADGLKPSTLESLFEEQQKIREQIEKTGKVPTLVAPSKLLEETYDLLQLDTSQKVSASARQTNERTRQRIASIFEANIQIATNNLGRDLSPEELRRVRDETLIEFTRKQTVDGWTEDYEIAVQQGMTDIFTLFDEHEAKRNAELEEVNKERIAKGQPVEQLLTPGALLRQAQEELATFITSEKARVDREIRAIESGRRRPAGAMSPGTVEDEYRRLQQQKRQLDEYEINAEELYLWLVDNDNKRYSR